MELCEGPTTAEGPCTPRGQLDREQAGLDLELPPRPAVRAPAGIRVSAMGSHTRPQGHPALVPSVHTRPVPCSACLTELQPVPSPARLDSACCLHLSPNYFLTPPLPGMKHFYKLEESWMLHS